MTVSEAAIFMMMVLKVTIDDFDNGVDGDDDDYDTMNLRAKRTPRMHTEIMATTSMTMQMIILLLMAL